MKDSDATRVMSFVQDTFVKATVNCLREGVDFSRQCLMLTRTGKYTIAEAEASRIRYIQWLALIKHYPSFVITPDKCIDDFWHMHILDTKKYDSDIKNFFGYYLHHKPHFNPSLDERELLASQYKDTRKIWKHHFEEELPYYEISGPDA